MGYEALGKARFSVEERGPTETIRIKARRRIFVLCFLPIWLTGWTVVGVVAIGEPSRQFSPFVSVWLCGWAAGWVFAAATLAWMLFGSETTRVVGRDLELGIQVGPWSRRKIYDGARIKGLKAAPVSDAFAAFRVDTPFLRRTQSGAVQFTYGERTVRAANGLDEAEGELIVDRLRRRLPAGASPQR